jgi:hypothetical protein
LRLCAGGAIAGEWTDSFDIGPAAPFAGRAGKSADSPQYSLPPPGRLAHGNNCSPTVNPAEQIR